MKQSLLFGRREVFPGSEILSRRAFRIMDIRDNCALLAKANRHLSQAFADSRGKSALFQKKDCFECLSPHKTAA